MEDDSVKIHPADLESYRIPTVIAGGAHSEPRKPFPYRKSDPGCRDHTFADAGHSAYFETPDDFNSVLDKFLRRHVQTS
jgi:pimeloyl-ACP methyl ester carboxylesterase